MRAHRDWLAAGLTVLWIGVVFMLMFTASDRFFCPAMELLSEYMRLSPAVAGATLLALGNGAPDILTQLSAAASVSRQAGGTLGRPRGARAGPANLPPKAAPWLPCSSCRNGAPLARSSGLASKSSERLLWGAAWGSDWAGDGACTRVARRATRPTA